MIAGRRRSPRTGVLRTQGWPSGGAARVPAATQWLSELAGAIVRLSDQDASTPVLVTPKYLSLQPAFFVALAVQIHSRCGRWPRFDRHRRSGGAAASLAERWMRWRLARIDRALAAAAGAGDSDRCEIALTAMIGRPGGVHRKLVVGWCDEGTELPAWVAPVYLSGAGVGSAAFR